MSKKQTTLKSKLQFSLRLHPRFFSTLFIAVAVIMVWRGIWNLLDIYLLPKMPLLSNIISILAGVALLYLPDGTLDELT